MNDSFGGGFTQQAIDVKSEGKAEGTLPTFIKMIHVHDTDTVHLFDRQYKMITTVALVRNIEHSSTKVTYDLEDFTGRVKAHLWVEEGEAPVSSNIMLNTYARVIGSVRQQGSSKSIMIYKIQPVQSINEVNTHYIEAINARFQAEEYCKIGDGLADGMKMNVDSGTGNRAEGSETLKGKDHAVFEAIRVAGESLGETGVSRQELSKKFTHINQNELNNIIDKLVTEGHIYSTIDSDHFLGCF